MPELMSDKNFIKWLEELHNAWNYCLTHGVVFDNDRLAIAELVKRVMALEKRVKELETGK